MLRIRLKRMGSRQDPFYRVVVSDGRTRPSGRFVDSIGTYNPGTDPASVKIDVARADEWISKGAKPSPTVKSLIQRMRSVEA